MINKSLVFITICLITFQVQGEERSEFPWLMTSYKHEHLNPEQVKIYLYSYFEAIGFILYSYASKEDPNEIKQINAWIDCVNDTKDSKSWDPELGWVFGENLDKSAAYILYNVVSPIVCEGYLEKAGTKIRTLRIFNYNDWDKWSIKDKSTYISGYVDTVASFQMRLKNAGVENYVRELGIVIDATGIDGILSEVMKTEFEPQYPLPWSVSRGLGAARNKVFSDKPKKSANEPYEVHCSEPLPVFTLGKDSKPTKEQERALCECLWENLGQWEREVAEKLSQGKESEVSKFHMSAFPSRFGSAIKNCGGMDL